MYRVDSADAQATLPAPSAPGPNPNYYYQDGSIITGSPGTVVSAEWMNMVQEEISNAVIGSGLTLNKATRNQLFQAISLLASKNFASSTTGTNTYAASIPTVSSYFAGLEVSIIFTLANTGASTININSLGAKNITTPSGAALVAGDFIVGSLVKLIYDGTEFVAMNTNNSENTIIASSYANPGYIQFRNSGLILQWGIVTVTGAATVTYPIAFPNNANGNQISVVGASPGVTITWAPLSTSQFAIHVSANATVQWFSFGN